jgi:hypothetical protein
MKLNGSDCIEDDIKMVLKYIICDVAYFTLVSLYDVYVGSCYVKYKKVNMSP